MLKQSENDALTLLGAGITLHECLAAAQALETDGTLVRVMDVFSVKPLDIDGILANVKQSHNRIVVVEDHYEAGGIGEALKSGLYGSGVSI